MQSPFEILGVPKTANDEQIKKAYKNLAKELHPDRTKGDPEKEERFKRVREAYDKIKTAKAREEYQREEMSKQYARQGFHGQNPFGDGQGFHYRSSDIDEDILNEIFGSFGMGGQGPRGFRSHFSQAREPEPLEVTINLSFWEAVKGGEKVFSFPQGSKISVKIPEGVRDGQKIRLKGQAHKLQNGAPGDLYLKTKVASEPTASYAKDGSVQIERDLPIDTAVLGGELHVNTPLGNFELNVPPYTNNGSKFKLKGKGPKGKDIIVKLSLRLPQEKKQGLQELFRSAQL